MQHIPIELANARQARDEAWTKYMQHVEDRENGLPISNEVIHELYKVCKIMEDHVSNVYDAWQRLGGTSNIETVALEADVADIMRWNDWQDEKDTIASIRADFHK